MKKTVVYCALLGGLLALGGCKPKAETGVAVAGEKAAAGTESAVWTVQHAECNIPFGNVTFTRAVNGADRGVQVEDGVMDFRCGGQTDFFCDPAEGKQPVATAPMLLTEVDNTKPFTFTAKVTPGFTPDGVYTAADLFVFAGDRLWQKLAFEQDERGNHRVVSVRTRGTSDDNNHDVITQPWVYLKISSDTHTFACYYSLDKVKWQMVRLYKNEYPETIWLGLCSQCPVGDGCVNKFEEVSLEPVSVANFRLGV